MPRPIRKRIITLTTAALIATAVTSVFRAGVYGRMNLLGLGTYRLSTSAGSLEVMWGTAQPTTPIYVWGRYSPTIPRLLPRYEGRHGVGHSVWIPGWAIVFPVIASQWLLGRSRRRKRRCTACGYDTSTIPVTVCPECGNKIPLRASRRGHA